MRVADEAGGTRVREGWNTADALVTDAMTFAGDVVAAFRESSNPAVVLPVHRFTVATSRTICVPCGGEFGMGQSVPVQCFKLHMAHLVHVGAGALG